MRRLLHLKWYFNNILAFLFFRIIKLKYFVKAKNERGILLINTGTLGDAVISSLIFNHENYSDHSEKMYLVVKKEYSDLFQEYSTKVEMIYLDQTKYKWSLKYRISFLKHLHSLQNRLCINLTSLRSISSDEIALLSGTHQVWCFSNSWRYIKKAFSRKMDSYYDKILFKYLTNEYDRHYKIYEMLFSEKNNNSTDDGKIILSNKPLKKQMSNEQYTVIAPLSSDITRTWGEKNYNLFSRLLSEKIHIIFVGTFQEKITITRLSSGVNNATNLAGQLKLNEIEKLIENSSLFIGNDSGLSHLALKKRTPLIAIIGGGNFGKYFPYKSNSRCIYFYYPMDCYGCEWNCLYKEKYCLTKINPLDVYNEALKILEIK